MTILDCLLNRTTTTLLTLRPTVSLTLLQRFLLVIIVIFGKWWYYTGVSVSRCFFLSDTITKPRKTMTTANIAQSRKQSNEPMLPAWLPNVSTSTTSINSTISTSTT